MTNSSELVNSATNVVTVWSDIGCPWATLALHTLRTEIRSQGENVLVDHRVFPLEFFNERPTPKPITDTEVVAIAGLIDDLGWRLWQAPDWTFPVTTLPALEAVQAAKHPDVGGLRASDELDAALRQAFWVDHECVSVFPVIYRIACQCPGVDVDALEWSVQAGHGRRNIYEHWVVAQSPQVICSPHVFLASGEDLANPGAHYTWVGGAERGFPRLVSYDATWAADVVASVKRASVVG